MADSAQDVRDEARRADRRATRSAGELCVGFAAMVVGVVVLVVALVTDPVDRIGEFSPPVALVTVGGLALVGGAVTFGTGLYHLGSRVDALYERLVLGEPEDERA